MTEQQSEYEATRKTNGQFGANNPGRRIGSENKAAKQRVGEVQALWPKARAQLEARVEAGDMTAIKLVCDYCLPRGGRPIDLESIHPNAAIEAAMLGDISPDEFARLSQGLKTAMDASNIDDIRKSLDELELLVASMRT